MGHSFMPYAIRNTQYERSLPWTSSVSVNGLIDMFPAELGRSHAEVSAFRPVPAARGRTRRWRLGGWARQAAFIGKVGDDPFGHFLVDVLAREGVETRAVRLDPEGARTTMNLMAQPDANHYDCLFSIAIRAPTRGCGRMSWTSSCCARPAVPLRLAQPHRRAGAQRDGRGGQDRQSCGGADLV